MDYFYADDLFISVPRTFCICAEDLFLVSLLGFSYLRAQAVLPSVLMTDFSLSLSVLRTYFLVSFCAQTLLIPVLRT